MPKPHIRPLEGKYYGTEIELNNQRGDVITVWVFGDDEKGWKPSEREKQNMINAYSSNDEAYEFSEEDLYEWASDSHYESAYGYAIAQKIVEALS